MIRYDKGEQDMARKSTKDSDQQKVPRLSRCYWIDDDIVKALNVRRFNDKMAGIEKSYSDYVNDALRADLKKELDQISKAL